MQADVEAKHSGSISGYVTVKTVNVVSYLRTGWTLVEKDSCINFSIREVLEKNLHSAENKEVNILFPFTCKRKVMAKNALCRRL